MNFNLEKPRPLDVLEQLNAGLDSYARKIYMPEEVDIFTPTYIEMRINKIIQLSEDDKSPITLCISTFGGDVHGMFGAIDVIQNASVKINTLGIGAVMSAGIGLLLAATGTRGVTKRTQLMIHQVSAWATGNTNSIEIEAKYTQVLQTEIWSFLESHSNKNKAYWKKQTDKANMYINATEALALGLVDHIV